MRIPKLDKKHFLVRSLWTIVFFLPFILIIVVTQWLEEYFPFSHFPMYDRMPEITFYVYVTDGDDNPIPSTDVFGERVSKLKRIYDTQLRIIKEQLDKRKYELTIEERQPAGTHTLEWAVKTGLERPGRRDAVLAYDTVRLYQAFVIIEDGKVVQPPHDLVGEIKITDPG